MKCNRITQVLSVAFVLFVLSLTARAEATAVIKGDQVEVASDAIAEPNFVRMGWFDIAIPNLMDKNGWPVFSFAGEAVKQ